MYLKLMREVYGMIRKNRAAPISVIAGLDIAICVITSLMFAGCGGSHQADTDKDPYFNVRRGPLTISITESGTIENRERIVVKNKVRARSTIVWVIDEGKYVKDGDLLLELDSSKIKDKKLDVEMRVQNADAGLIGARENLEIDKNQAQSDNEKAELDLRFAELDLKKYMEGEYPQELQKAESDITIAQEELQRAEDKQEWSRQLSESGYITRSELQADELVVKRNQINIELAKGKLDLLKRYTHPQQVEKLQSDVKQAQMALERTLRRSKAKVLQAEATLRAKQSEYDQVVKQLGEINEELANCEIKAPAAGMVVYAAGSGNHWGRNEEPLSTGLEINEGQELIYLPANREMQAKIGVPETSRTKIKDGMKALVRIDALPGRVFNGKLSKMGILPDASRSWMNPDLKIYNCEVLIDEVSAEVRPGMGCRVEIIIQEMNDAVYVPVQCVTRVAGYPTAYVKSGRGNEQRKIEIGADNNQMVHVISGLDVGEKVMLAPPLEASRGAGKNRAAPSEQADTQRSRKK